MKYMEIQSGPDISLMEPMMSTDLRENRSIPEWITSEVMPKARDDRKPLLDIYAEILRIQETLARIELQLNRPPWYRRIWERMKEWLYITSLSL